MIFEMFQIALTIGFGAVLFAVAFLIVAGGISIIRGDDDEKIHRR